MQVDESTAKLILTSNLIIGYRKVSKIGKDFDMEKIREMAREDIEFLVKCVLENDDDDDALYDNVMERCENDPVLLMAMNDVSVVWEGMKEIGMLNPVMFEGDNKTDVEMLANQIF